MYRVKIKRIYEQPEATDGYRMLVDRLWPRGVKKENAHLNEWNKTIPPSTALRKWFNHQDKKFSEFSERYRYELHTQPEELQRIKSILKAQNLTLLYAAKDPKINHAVVLLSVLNNTHL